MIKIVPYASNQNGKLLYRTRSFCEETVLLPQNPITNMSYVENMGHVVEGCERIALTNNMKKKL